MKSHKIMVESLVACLTDFHQQELGSAPADTISQISTSILNQIYQSWEDEEVYPTIEHKAAMLLYLFVKSHSFIDGNKRSGAFAFLWYLEYNSIDISISPEALADMVIMIAAYSSSDKEKIIEQIIHNISKKDKEYNQLDADADVERLMAREPTYL